MSNVPVNNSTTSSDDFEVTVTGNETPYYGSTVGDWDTIIIGAVTFANTKIVLDGAPEYKIDVKPAPGTDGARETPIGYVPARITVTVELWNDALMAGWKQLVGYYKPKPGKTKPVPITVDHPLLRMFNLSRFYVTVTPLPKALGSQTYEGRLNLLEYFAAPKAAGTQSPTVTGATIYTGDLEPGGSFEGTSKPPAKPSSNNTGPT